ncbi:type I phosphomannose isomerase catalytic subunit [Fonticella tunisiensis]|uniref:Phosphohexomutase n=1 Tax=Fonticella tunisiensis TaxID=1096341 RepID=A0A4R7KPJ6_9CLOT|nr:type I phosphomannose isomerase catalytic subunit [Fonticella tunisiensis]TDT61060.1 mannose-6-phosphate isomerase type 1 [Fonticella tunisiensis]
MLYPLFFEPVYKEIIWGGRNLEKVFNRNLPEGKVAESWEVCCHKNGMSIVSNGEFKDKSLEELIKEHGERLLGTKASSLDRFPLLIKFIDANDRLSVQVHPGNEYALKVEGDLGKTEMWYILEAKEGAKLIYGTKPGVSKEEFKRAIENGTLEDYLNYVDVKKGDVAFIPAGTVHAIMDGLLIAEIQQNSDTTYRVYDWNRVDKNGKGRELHIDKALDVINFDFKGEVSRPVLNDFEGYSIGTLVTCDFFTVDKIVINEKYVDKTDGTSFFIFTAVEGEGEIIYDDQSYPIKSGNTFMVPADPHEFTIKGNLTLIKSYL